MRVDITGMDKLRKYVICQQQVAFTLILITEKRFDVSKCDKNNVLANLNDELFEFVEENKWSIKAACHIACLEIDAEQLWVLRFYKENGILPTIKQAKEIKEVHDKNKLTVKAFKAIMSSRLKPKWLVFHYNDISRFFEETITPDEMKHDVLKVLSNWKNKINK